MIHTGDKSLLLFDLPPPPYPSFPCLPAIPVDIRSIDDTSNFDEFPDIDLSLPVVDPANSGAPGGGVGGGLCDLDAAFDPSGRYKDWVFLNYTFKRFDGLTQRGVPRPLASQALQLQQQQQLQTVVPTPNPKH